MLRWEVAAGAPGNVPGHYRIGISLGLGIYGLVLQIRVDGDRVRA